MKRKQLVAILLAGVLGVSAMTVPAFAEGEEIVSEEAVETAAEPQAESSAETESDSQEIPEEEPSAPVEEGQAEAEEPVENTEPVETKAPETETPAAPVDTVEEPAADSAEVTKDESAEEDPEKVTATEIVSDEAALEEKIAGAVNGEITVITVSGTIEITHPVTISSGKKISIITLDEPAVLKRADSLKDDLFTVESGSFLTFLGAGSAKLTLDGSGSGVTGSLISMKEGSQVSVTGNVVLTGNKTTDAKAGAITNDGGLLVLDGGTISDNQGEFGAVYTETDVILGSPSSDFDPDPISEITITDNQNAAGENGNLVLAGEDSRITVVGTLEASRIAVSFEDIEKREDTTVLSAQGATDVEELLEQSIALDEIEAYADYSIDAEGILQKAGDPEADPTATPTPEADPTATPAPEADPTATPTPEADPTATPEPTVDPEPESYTVTFDLNLGDSEEEVTPVDPKVVAANETLDLTTVTEPTRDKYVFKGWYASPEDAEDPVASPVVSPLAVTEDTTLYAKWIREYEITFDVNGGDAYEEEPVICVEAGDDADISDVDNPTRSGYSFTGWYLTAETSGDPVKDKFTISEDTVLYAGWAKLVTLTYNTNGGTEITAETVAEGTSVTLKTPRRAGYAFVGWYTESDLSGTALGRRITVNADTTVYAKWVEATHTLSFDSNGGTAVASREVAAGVAFDLTSVEEPVRDGYNFIGWYRTKTDSPKRADAVGDTITVDGDTVLYAGWERKPIISDVLDSTITGLDGVLKFGLRITSSGKVQGDSVNFTAVGAGTDITTPVVGDERWVPICWNMDPNKYNSYTNSSGATVSADRRDADKNGKYTLTLNPTKAAIDNYLKAAKENPSLLEDPEYFGSASNPKTKAAVYVYFRRQVYEEGTGWTDKNVKYIKKPIRYYMVLEKESGEEYTEEEIQRVVATGGGVDALAEENDSDPESTGSTTADGAKTGDESPIGAMSLLLAVSFLVGSGIILRKKKVIKAEKKK